MDGDKDKNKNRDQPHLKSHTSYVGSLGSGGSRRRCRSVMIRFLRLIFIELFIKTRCFRLIECLPFTLILLKASKLSSSSDIKN